MSLVSYPKLSKKVGYEQNKACQFPNLQPVTLGIETFYSTTIFSGLLKTIFGKFTARHLPPPVQGPEFSKLGRNHEEGKFRTILGHDSKYCGEIIKHSETVKCPRAKWIHFCTFVVF
jgi:hypothetical protein